MHIPCGLGYNWNYDCQVSSIFMASLLATKGVANKVQKKTIAELVVENGEDGGETITQKMGKHAFRLNIEAE